MHEQLETLLELQDLQAQKESLMEEGPIRQVEFDVFEVELEEAIRRLDEKLRELEDRLEPDVRQRYRRVSQRGQRAVVPVLQGICYGCFMAVPTAWAAEAERNERIAVCQNCGRFLYHVD